MTLLPTTFNEIIFHGAEKYAAQPALICKDRTVTYTQLREMSHRLAHAFVEEGIKPGDRVAVVLPNGWHFVVATFASILSGAIVVPLDYAIRSRNFEHVIRNCSVKAVILDCSAFARLEKALTRPGEISSIFVENLLSTPRKATNKLIFSLDDIYQSQNELIYERTVEVDPNSVVSITYTSGSTGEPKGVMHSHRSWISSAIFTGDYLRISEGGRILLPLPLHHTYSFRHILTYLIYGGTCVVAGDLLDGLKALKKEKAIALLLVPAACNIILQQFKELIRECCQQIDFVCIGTAPVSPEQLTAFQSLLPNTEIHLPYGLTEARVGFLRISDDCAPKEIMTLAPGLEISVVNNKGEPVGIDETGEITIKGEGMMLGYWPSSAAEQKALRKGGFRTGDIGKIDLNDTISLMGRIDDIIKVGGRKVDPHEVESILNQHPLVLESAVSAGGDPNSLLDNALRAVVVLQNGKTISENKLLEHCKKYLEPYKMPTSIIFEPLLHKSTMGKIKKTISNENVIVNQK